MLSIQDVIDLSALAQKGDQTALKTLLTETRKQGLIANKRLKRLEKAGFENQPYNKALYYLQTEVGTDYFTTSKKRLSADIGLLETQLKQIISFNKLKSSTVGGYRKVIEETMSRLRKGGIDVPEDQEAAMMQFLDSGAFKGVLQYDSGNSLDKISDLLRSGVTVDHLKKVWKDFQNGKYKDELEAFESIEETSVKED